MSRSFLLLLTFSVWFFMPMAVVVSAQNNTTDKFTVLLSAIEKGETSKVIEIVDAAAKPEQEALISGKDSRYGGTLLHWAAYRKNADLVAYLIAHGAQIMKPNKAGDISFHQAAVKVEGKTDEDAIKILDLLDSEVARTRLKTNYNFKNKDGVTPLYLACSAGYIKVIDFFLEKGVVPDETAMVYAREIKNDGALQAQVLNRLVSKNASLAPPVIKSDLPAAPKVASTSSPRVKKEISSPATPQIVFEQIRSLISKKDKGALLQLIKSFDSGIYDKEDENGDTLLHIAAKNCSAEIVALLIKQGANPEAKNGSQQTFLEVACPDKTPR